MLSISTVLCIVAFVRRSMFVRGVDGKVVILFISPIF